MNHSNVTNILLVYKLSGYTFFGDNIRTQSEKRKGKEIGSDIPGKCGSRERLTPMCWMEAWERRD